MDALTLTLLHADYRDSTDKEPPSPREIEEKLSGVRQDHQEKLDALRREQAKTEQDLVDKYRDIVSTYRVPTEYNCNIDNVEYKFQMLISFVYYR